MTVLLKLPRERQSPDDASILTARMTAVKCLFAGFAYRLQNSGWRLFHLFGVRRFSQQHLLGFYVRFTLYSRQKWRRDRRPDK